MSARVRISTKTLKTWAIDAVALTSGLVSILSGIYFLYLPSGGYEGGRNPLYGVTILFDRHTWEELHTWSSIVMIVMAIVHFALHWSWVRMSSRRVRNHLVGAKPIGSPFARFNIALNAAVGISFLVCALSGLYFYFTPTGGFQGGANLQWDAGFVFSRTTWDLIHTWSGVAFSASIVVHFAIHWRWVTHVTSALLRPLGGRKSLSTSVVAG